MLLSLFYIDNVADASGCSAMVAAQLAHDVVGAAWSVNT